MHLCVKERLQLVCKHKGMKLKEFHQETGLAYRTAQSYLDGSRTPNAEGFFAICTQLGVNLNWLLTGEGQPFIDTANTATDTLSPDEQQLLTEYRSASDASKAIILTIAQTQEKKAPDTQNRQVS